MKNISHICQNGWITCPSLARIVWQILWGVMDGWCWIQTWYKPVILSLFKINCGNIPGQFCIQGDVIINRELHKIIVLSSSSQNWPYNYWKYFKMWSCKPVFDHHRLNVLTLLIVKPEYYGQTKSKPWPGCLCFTSLHLQLISSHYIDFVE